MRFRLVTAAVASALSQSLPFALAFFVLAVGEGAAQVGGDPREPIAVVTNLPDDFVAADFPLEIELDSEPQAGTTIAIFVGGIDLTAMFEQSGGVFRFVGPLSLPAGDRTLVVQRYSDSGDWSELARVPMRVLTRSGFRPLQSTVSGSMTLEAGIAAAESPAPGGDESLPRIANGQLQISSELTQEDGWWMSVEGDLLVTSDQTQALRYGSLGDSAPQLDLASYQIRSGLRSAQVAWGNLSAGRQRHLIQGHLGRGGMISAPLGQSFNASLAVLAGNNAVGWSDLLGITESQNRVVTGQIEFSADNATSELYIGLTGMSGSILPALDFGQGTITDAEQSSGLGMDIRSRLLDSRLRVEAGMAASRFSNPFDPRLAQGLTLTRVSEDTHFAHYVEAVADILDQVAISDSRVGHVSIAFRREQVDPLFRSIGSYVQADRLQQEVSLEGGVTGIGLRLGIGNSRNNLKDLPSILTSETERLAAQLDLNLVDLVGGSSALLPIVSASLEQVDQAGRNVPESGGFQATHVPDQSATNKSLSMSWTLGNASVSYSWNNGFQDNRQEGRANSDFKNTFNQLSSTFVATSWWVISADWAHERAEAFEFAEVSTANRLGLTSSVTLWNLGGLSLRLARSEGGNREGTTSTSNESIDLSWTGHLPQLGSLNGQYFSRFGWNNSESVDKLFDANFARRIWNVDVGFSLGM